MDFKNKYEEETKQKPYCWNESGQYVRSGSYNDGYVKWLEEQLRQHFVVSSCVDKDELISDLDDRRVVGIEMAEDMWYFCRKQTAEYLLDKYKLIRK